MNGSVVNGSVVNGSQVANGSGPGSRSVRTNVRAELVAVGRQWSSSLYRLVHLVRELDRSGEWALDGSRTCAHWVASALDVEVATARQWLRVGKTLGERPLIDEAFAAGRISFSKVRLLTGVVDAGNEADLLEIAERTPAGRLAGELARWLQRHEEPDDTEARQHEMRSLTWRTDPDGMITATIRLTPFMASVFMAAVDTQLMQTGTAEPTPSRTLRPADHGTSDLTPAKPSGAEKPSGAAKPAEVKPEEAKPATAKPATVVENAGDGTAVPSKPRSVARSDAVDGWATVPQQRADALMSLVDGGGANVDAEVVLHVRGDGCTLDDGTPIASSVVERIAPEAFLRVLIHDAERRPINASGRHRHPTSRQRRVVHERDRGCVDCGTTEHLEFDHQPDFAISGHTVIDELRERCWTCHRARHAAEQVGGVGRRGGVA